TAANTSGCVCPRIIGPHEHTRSTYSRPSTSVRYGPLALAMNRGAPPTARKARTGLLTPPGVTATARVSSAWEAGASYGYGVCGEIMAAIESAFGCDRAFLRRAVPRLREPHRKPLCS